jgi:putative solute:sodium symporter small subunit
MAVKLDKAKLDAYHRKNVRMIILLLAVWFLVSLGGVAAVKPLNHFVFLGFPFGYWLGSQGSILTFIAEIFFYARYMGRLDREYGFAEDLR